MDYFFPFLFIGVFGLLCPLFTIAAIAGVVIYSSRAQDEIRGAWERAGTELGLAYEEPENADFSTGASGLRLEGTYRGVPVVIRTEKYRLRPKRPDTRSVYEIHLEGRVEVGFTMSTDPDRSAGGTFVNEELEAEYPDFARTFAVRRDSSAGVDVSRVLNHTDLATELVDLAQHSKQIDFSSDDMRFTVRRNEVPDSADRLASELDTIVEVVEHFVEAIRCGNESGVHATSAGPSDDPRER